MSEFSDSQTPGLWLRRQREAAGLTQEELAHQSGLSVRAISNLERDRTSRPQADSLHRIVTALGMAGSVAPDLIRRYRVGRYRSASSPPAPADGGPALGAAAWDVDPAARGSSIVPRQLPPAAATFTGRASELAFLDEWLDEALRDSDRAVVISAIGGMAGVGKTALALYWANRVAGRFPDGQLYADLHGYDPGSQPAEAAEVVRGFLQALGVAPEVIPPGVDGQVALYRSVLAGRRMLIVADNARTAAQVRPLLPGMPGSVLLVTSRSRLSGLAAAEGARMLNLDVLTESDAVGLLAARLGADRVEVEPQAVAELIRLCGRLPLALAVVAARAVLSGWPLDVLARQLAGADDRLGELGLDDPASDVRAVFSWSSRQLSDEAARMFRLLAVHPGPDISVPAAASLARVPVPRAVAALRELAAASLAIERMPGRYLLHDLVRAYAAKQDGATDWDNEREAAVSAMVDHYVHAAMRAAHVLDPGQPEPTGPPAAGLTSEQVSGIDQALAWFDAERKVLLAVVTQAAGTGAGKRAGQLAGAFEPFCTRRCHWADLAAMQQAALDLCDQMADLPGRARAHLNLGRALGRVGPADAASMHLTRAIELAHALGDQATQARAYLMLAFIQPDPAGAAENAQHALQLAENAGNTALMALACNNLGYHYALYGDPERALVHCQRAVDLCRQSDSDPALEGYIHDSLGLTYLRLGDQRQALASYTRAVRRFRAIGALHVGADSLVRLGDCHAAAGNAVAAVDAWQQALVMLDELGHPDSGQIRRKLGEHARLTGNGTRPAS